MPSTGNVSGVATESRPNLDAWRARCAYKPISFPCISKSLIPGVPVPVPPVVQGVVPPAPVVQPVPAAAQAVQSGVIQATKGGKTKKKRKRTKKRKTTKKRKQTKKRTTKKK